MDLLNSPVLDSQVLAQKLQMGSAALMPTDTLPALISSPSHASKLWRLKNRPLRKPLILMAASPQDLFNLVLPCALEDAWKMSKKFWPGALTLVLPAAGEILHSLNQASDSLGMRIPNSEMSLALLRQSGPIATTSANLSGSLPSSSAEEVSSVFPGIPLLGPVPWPNASGMASTVLSWQRAGSWKVLRQGAVYL